MDIKPRRSFLFGLLTLSLIRPNIFAQESYGKGNGGDKPMKKIIKLQPTTIEPSAGGIAKIMIKSNGNAMQKFQVVGTNLKQNTNYRLFVDGLEIAAALSAQEAGDNSSSVEFMFAKKSKGKVEGEQLPLPASLDPVTKIRHVEIRDSNNQTILMGDFSA